LAPEFARIRLIIPAVYYIFYTISTSFLTSIHYTGVYKGKVAVLVMLFPTRVDTSCGGLWLPYLRTIYWSAGSTGTVSRRIRNLRERLSSSASFV